MSKPSKTSTPKIPTQLPQKSAWARGPPQPEASISASSKRSRWPTSPPKDATNQPVKTRSKPSNIFGQNGVTIKAGINITSRGALKSNLVTFGSIDEDSGMLHSSPANLPSIKTEDVKSFGTVPVENGGGMPSPSPGDQQAGPSSFEQPSSTLNPLPPTISPIAAKLVVPSLSDTDESMPKVDVPALSPTPARKIKKLIPKRSQKSPPSSLAIIPPRDSDPLLPSSYHSLSTVFPTPSSGLVPFDAPRHPSALAAASAIEDLGQVSYPEGVMSPKPELNVNSKKGRFIYDREFLLQFMAICTEKPDFPSGITLGIIGLQGNQPDERTDRPSKPGTPNGLTMGSFSTPSSKLTSEERFGMSQCLNPNSAPDRGQQNLVVETGSQTVPRSQRTRSKRGGARKKDQVVNLEPVAPQEVSGNRWARSFPADGEHDVGRRVRALLNNFTADNFNPISNHIVALANKSETEKDCQSLVYVTRVVFENAINEPARSGLYARLCRSIMERINPNIRDDEFRSAGGKPIAGGQLFRKYLLHRCQTDFNRGVVVKVAAGVALTKAAETSGEAEPYLDGYHAAQKDRRQRLGLIQFYGELYKVRMLTERIVHECLKTLLGNAAITGEEGIEGSCRLLMTVGRLLDNPKARSHMDHYLTRVTELAKGSNVTPRVHLILQDLVELRERKWVARGQVTNEDEANKRISEDTKELFSARNIDESEEYFNKLPREHHHRLVDKVVSKAIEMKEADGKLVADMFARAVEKGLCSIAAFEEGFSPVTEVLDEIVIDAPKALQIMAVMMRGAGLDKDVERLASVVQKLTNGDKLLELLA